MDRVDFLLRQRPLHVSVDNSEAQTVAARLWVCKLVMQRHLLDDVAADVSHQVVKVVGCESFEWNVRRQPEGQVVGALRVLRHRLVLEVLVELLVAELVEEAAVLTPEEANVGDLIEDHRQPLQAQSEGEPDGVVHACLAQNLVLHHAAAENFHPTAVVEDFELPRRLSEREESVDLWMEPISACRLRHRHRMLTHRNFNFRPKIRLTRPSSRLFISCSTSFTDSTVWHDCLI